MGGRGEETTTLGNRQKRTQQITPCPSLAPDIPLSPGKIEPLLPPARLVSWQASRSFRPPPPVLRRFIAPIRTRRPPVDGKS